LVKKIRFFSEPVLKVANGVQIFGMFLVLLAREPRKKEKALSPLSLCLCLLLGSLLPSLLHKAFSLIAGEGTKFGPATARSL